MKKFLIGLCATSLLAASAVGYAGSVKLVNKYDQPVTFVVSHGSVYNPVVIGTLGAGEWSKVSIDGSFTPDDNFMAFLPNQSTVVTNCGTPDRMMNNVVIKAGWSKQTGMFTCRVYKYTPTAHPVKKQGCHCQKPYCHHHHGMVKHAVVVKTTTAK